MKDLFQNPSRIIVTCNKRLAPFLKLETEALGYQIDRMFPTGIELKGTMKDCIHLNLRLRCASQILYSLKTFRSDKPDDVYRSLVAFAWEEVVPSNGYVCVTSKVDHFTVNNNLFINVKVKDAIADRIRNQSGQRPDSGPLLDFTVVHLYWKDERAEVFIDTSGHTLAKHGYRKIPGKAPMLEALVAGTLLAMQWDRKCPFVNPMCGSSTVAIEAALLATSRYPGLFRSAYGFMHVKGYQPSYYEVELARMKASVEDRPGLKIIATDNREDAIAISKVNAEAAGVLPYLEFSVCDFRDTPVPSPPGVIFFNPEYGERLGELKELEATYEQLGDFLKKKCQGYMGYIFSGNMELAKKIGLKAKRRIEFYSAKLDCRLLEYELYAGTRRSPRVEPEDGNQPHDN